MIRKDPEKFRSVSEALARSTWLNGMTILHACIRFDPPPQIVQMIIDLTPFSPNCVDCLNRTPLHVAAAIRANPKSVAILISACRQACAFQDADGKTPLHYACDVNCVLFEDEEGVERAQTSMDVIKCLALSSIASVPLEDIEGISALEYAILSVADVEIVRFLMRVTQLQLSQAPREIHVKYCEES